MKQQLKVSVFSTGVCNVWCDEAEGAGQRQMLQRAHHLIWAVLMMRPECWCGCTNKWSCQSEARNPSPLLLVVDLAVKRTNAVRPVFIAFRVSFRKQKCQRSTRWASWGWGALGLRIKTNKLYLSSLLWLSWSGPTEPGKRYNNVSD